MTHSEAPYGYLIYRIVHAQLRSEIRTNLLRWDIECNCSKVNNADAIDARNDEEQSCNKHDAPSL